MGHEDGGQAEAQGPVGQRGQLLRRAQGDGQALHRAQRARDNDEGGALCVFIQDKVAWAEKGWWEGQRGVQGWGSGELES